jgi:hypothetical protein
MVREHAPAREHAASCSWRRAETAVLGDDAAVVDAWRRLHDIDRDEVLAELVAIATAAQQAADGPGLPLYRERNARFARAMTAAVDVLRQTGRRA